MGRTLKRVPMDFDWPLGRVWKGFLNPYRGCECPWCYDDERRGSLGWTREAREYERTWYGHLIGGRYVENPYHPDRRYCPQAKPYTLEQWEYDFIAADDERLRKQFFGCDRREDVPPFEGLTDWLLQHDGEVMMRTESIFVYVMAKEYCRRNGFADTCPHCEGTGLVWQSDELRRLHEEWEPIEPPTGEGYQMWSTTNEGNPRSPVFATMDELCEWCADNATTFARFKATKEEWRQMLDDDFVYHQEGNVVLC